MHHLCWLPVPVAGHPCPALVLYAAVPSDSPGEALLACTPGSSQGPLRDCYLQTLLPDVLSRFLLPALPFVSAHPSLESRHGPSGDPLFPLPAQLLYSGQGKQGSRGWSWRLRWVN